MLILCLDHFKFLKLLSSNYYLRLSVYYKNHTTQKGAYKWLDVSWKQKKNMHEIRQMHAKLLVSSLQTVKMACKTYVSIWKLSTCCLDINYKKKKISMGHLPELSSRTRVDIALVTESAAYNKSLLRFLLSMPTAEIIINLKFIRHNKAKSLTILFLSSINYII